MTEPTFSLGLLLDACGEDGQTAAVCVDTHLVPIGGPGSPVNPAIHAGGKYQYDKRWESPDADRTADVIVIDNVPSQANRLEAALDADTGTVGFPRLVLDLTGEEFAHLPPHLPRRLSSLRFPHRNADAYLRDSLLEGEAFPRTRLGRAILTATASTAGPLVAWFPQALLYGFWQSHLGAKRSQAKHARAWTSEIVGWCPATAGPDQEPTPTLGTKGDDLNLGDTARVDFDKDDYLGWEYVEGKKSTKGTKLSEIGHGQVPFEGGALAAVSFKRITQSATCSFAQLRRVRLGDGSDPARDTAARAVLAAMGLHAHRKAFGRGFALRSGSDLVPESTSVRFHGGPSLGFGDTVGLLQDALAHARESGVPLDGWQTADLTLTPNGSLTKAILGSWPNLDGGTG